MKLLVLGMNYAPEQTGIAPHTTALCEYLAGQGHKIIVLTGFPWYPEWARWPAYRGLGVQHEDRHQVTVWRLPHFIPHRPGSVLNRIGLEGSFCVLAIRLLVRQLRYALRGIDGVMYTGAQPSLAMLARGIARWCGVPYVVKITDLATQAATDVGIVRAPWLRQSLASFEYAAYARASGAIVLCEGFQEALLARQYPREQIRIIRDSVDLEQIRPSPYGARFRQTAGLTGDDFVVMHSGSMGQKQGLANVINAARLLKDTCPAIKWVLVGDGEVKLTLQRLVATHGLSGQVRFLPFQPEAEMSAMLSAADVLLLNQLRSMKDSVLPSKLMMYMASGRPVLAAVNATSQAAVLLQDARGGIPVQPEDPAALAQAVQDWQGRQEALQKMGRCNRVYAEQHFDQRKIVAAQEEFLTDILNQGVM